MRRDPPCGASVEGVRMNWKSALSKVGKVALEVTKQLPVYGPIVTALIPGKKDDEILQTVMPTFELIGTAIEQAERFGTALGLTGADKLKAAAVEVGQLVLSSALLAGKKIQDPVLYQRGCTKIADGMADIHNSIHPDGVKVVDRSA